MMASEVMRNELPGANAVAPSQLRAQRWTEVLSHLDPRRGGLSAAVPELARNIARLPDAPPLDVGLTAFCAPEEHFHTAHFADDELSFWPASRRVWLSDFLSGGRLQKKFREHLKGFDGVHIHGLWEHSTELAAGTARSLGIPYILSAHGMLEPWALHTKRVKKMVYAQLCERANVRHARCLHALTRAEADGFRRFGATSPIAVIPNAVTCPSNCTSNSFYEAFPELSGKRLLFFLGRLHVKKGLEPLLHVWSTVAHKYPDAHLVVSGPDADGTGQRLQRLIEEMSLQPHVLLTGMLQGELKWSALAAAEVFVLPSFSEGLSVGVLEAMGMGRPVIVTRPCNMPDVTEHEAGWEIDPEPSQISFALQEALRNSPQQNASIGQRGAALVRARYTWPVVGQQMAELYHWATGGPVPGSFELLRSV